MSKPRLLVARAMPPAVTERLSRDYECLGNESDQPWAGVEIVRRAQGCEAMLVTPTEKLNSETIAALPASVRMIATFSVGYDHIDVAAAQARGLVLSHTPDVLTDATADIAMLLLLAAARRAHEGETMVRADQWRGWSSMMLVGVGLAGKRLGILGMGRIGQAVARRARAFGMQIHYHNRSPLAPAQTEGAQYHRTPDELFAVSDFISLHAPANAATRTIVNERTIGLLPQGAILVNTARGDLVDDDALIAALRSGRIMAAGLDVFRNEPNLDPRYRELPNVFLLPHLGSATIETRTAMGMLALDNLDAFFAGRPLPSPIEK